MSCWGGLTFVRVACRQTARTRRPVQPTSPFFISIHAHFPPTVQGLASPLCPIRRRAPFNNNARSTRNPLAIILCGAELGAAARAPSGSAAAIMLKPQPATPDRRVLSTSWTRIKKSQQLSPMRQGRGAARACAQVQCLTDPTIPARAHQPGQQRRPERHGLV